jgi:hypothetical protein
VQGQGVDIIDQHYAAYGAADIDALAATLAPDFLCGPVGGAPWITGRAAARAMYARNVIDWPLSKTDHLATMALGSRVIRHERSTHATDGSMADVLAIYTVTGGLISHLDMGGREGDAPASAAVAEAQLVAYNAQDLDAHVACFAGDVTIANLHEAPNLHGNAAYRERMGGVFAQFPHNRVELLGRIACGNVVCDHERVFRSPDAEPFEVIAVYLIDGGRVSQVHFIR